MRARRDPGRSEPRGIRPRLRSVPHAHLSIGDLSFGFTHVHVDGDSFLVGALPGIAGSGVLVVILVGAAPSTGAAVGFLAAFTALSIATMAAIAAIGRRTLGTPTSRHLQTAAGVLAVAMGSSLPVESIAVFGVF